MISPYEIYEGKIGVQARFLYEAYKSKQAAANSLTLISYQGLNYKVSKGYICKLRPNSPGHPLLLDWHTLPEVWKRLLIQAFGEPKTVVRRSDFDRFYERDLAALEFFMGHPRKNGTHLKPEVINEYTQNASILNTMERFYKHMRDSRRSIKFTAGAYKDVNGVTHPSVWQLTCMEANRYREIEPHTLPIHEDTLRKLMSRYKAEGYRSLLSKKIDNDNALKVTDIVVELLNALFAGQAHKPSYIEVANSYNGFKAGYVEVINQDDGVLYNPDDFPNISKSTVQRWLSMWENRSVNESVRPNNRQRTLGKFSPYHSFKKPQFAGSIISVDDRQPPFWFGDKQRMWFYMAYDVGAEVFTCWVWDERKEGLIIPFYRQMVRNYAEWKLPLPVELECEMSLNSTLRETILREGEMFTRVHMEANNARAKYVERIFGEIRKEDREKDGFLARPHAIAEAWQGDEHKKVLPKEVIIERCLKQIEDWNNRPHSRVAGKSRWDFFLETQHPDARPINYRSILLSIGYCTKTTCRTGILQLNNREFLLGEQGEVSLGERLIGLLKEAEGQKVEVYWLDDNDGEVLKAHIYVNGQYLCEAVAKPVYHRARVERTAEDEKAQQVMSAYVATVNKFIREGKERLQRVLVIDNTPVTTGKNVFRIRQTKSVLTGEDSQDAREVNKPDGEEVFVLSGEETRPADENGSYKIDISERF